jgi:hypothetical protein
MKKNRLLRTLPFAVAVCAALGFGAQAAVASARPCPLTSIGSCGSQKRCQDACAARGSTGGTCTNGCCFCPLAF